MQDDKQGGTMVELVKKSRIEKAVAMVYERLKDPFRDRAKFFFAKAEAQTIAEAVRHGGFEVSVVDSTEGQCRLEISIPGVTLDEVDSESSQPQ